MPVVGLIEEFEKPRCIERTPNVHQLCRQLSVELPEEFAKGSVSSLFAPVVEAPANGARIRIVCVGACFKQHNCVLSAESNAPLLQSPFSGSELAGIVESLGKNVNEGNKYDIRIGQRVVVYPYEEISQDYSELFIVPDLKHLIAIPDDLSTSLAALLPTDALLPMGAVIKAHEVILEILGKRQNQTKNDTKPRCKMLIAGTGGLALWTLRIAEYYFALKDTKNNIDITIVSLTDRGLRLTKEIENIKIVQWNESLYEQQLIERTTDTCNGSVDVVIDYGNTLRSLKRSLHCLSKDGVILTMKAVVERLLDNSQRLYEQYQQQIIPLTMGTINQLHELVSLVAQKKIQPPPYTVYPYDYAIPK